MLCPVSVSGMMQNHPKPVRIGGRKYLALTASHSRYKCISKRIVFFELLRLDKALSLIGEKKAANEAALSS